MQTDIVMGIPVDALTMEDIVKDVPNYLSEDKKMTLISVNPQIVTEAAGYPEVVAFIKQSTHRIPDGIGIVLVSKLTGGPIKERVAGYDLMLEMLAYADRHQKSIFLYGAKPNVLKDTDKHVREMYPNLRIVGMIDGYVTSTDEEIVKQIMQYRLISFCCVRISTTRAIFSKTFSRSQRTHLSRCRWKL